MIDELQPCPLPQCRGEAIDLSSTAGECVQCTACGLSISGDDALSKWNDRSPGIHEQAALAIYERIRAKYAENPDDVADAVSQRAAVEFAQAVAASIQPPDNLETVNVGIGMWVHGDPVACRTLRSRLQVLDDEQVPEPLALIQQAEQVGFTFDGQSYRATLPAIAALLRIARG